MFNNRRNLYAAAYMIASIPFILLGAAAFFVYHGTKVGWEITKNSVSKLMG